MHVHLQAKIRLITAIVSSGELLAVLFLLLAVSLLFYVLQKVTDRSFGSGSKAYHSVVVPMCRKVTVLGLGLCFSRGIS